MIFVYNIRKSRVNIVDAYDELLNEIKLTCWLTCRFERNFDKAVFDKLDRNFKLNSNICSANYYHN